MWAFGLMRLCISFASYCVMLYGVSLFCLFVCVLCLCDLRLVYDSLLHCVSIVLLCVCVLLLLRLCDVNMVYCVHVYGLCLCSCVFKRVGFHVLVCFRRVFFIE